MQNVQGVLGGLGGGGMGGGAYGGGKAGATFDPVAFVQRPTTIVRIASWLFSVIVFGCISSQGWEYDYKNDEDVCKYNGDSGACSFPVGVGVLAFLGTMAFLAGDALFDQLSSLKLRKRYVMADLGFSGFWSFLYFIAFCYMANAWRKSESPQTGANNMRSAIIFAFLCIFTFAGSAFFAFQRYKLGAAQEFAGEYEQESGMGGIAPPPYSYPGAADMSAGVGGTGAEVFSDPSFGSMPPGPGQPAFHQGTY
ncbi:unnamed protein product [Cyprideis torosa]|uniref:Synaptogyrin n=1 Tax=Cyprideis torosa TaxID=163714 RepID=A0A7R8ZIV9_9CRUS|nr:unnamed protein product [Cyprideis torosa]CAG0887111.1 unnamed protein product [Cyprideis torosa]